MLVRRLFSLTAAPMILAAGLLTGCVIVDGTSGTTGGQGGNDPTTTSSSGTTGTGGEGGAAGTGGGAGVGGAGGAMGTGGAGGGVACAGTMGTATITDCDNMNITPATAGGAAQSCGMNFDEEPIGYRVCKKGSTIFIGGAFDVLQSCLSSIGVQYACDVAPANDCISEMYGKTCDDPYVHDICNNIQTQCGMDPFDANACAGYLLPLSNDGITALNDCLAAAPQNDPCQKQFDDCYAQLMTF